LQSAESTSTTDNVQDNPVEEVQKSEILDSTDTSAKTLAQLNTLIEESMKIYELED